MGCRSSSPGPAALHTWLPGHLDLGVPAGGTRPPSPTTLHTADGRAGQGRRSRRREALRRASIRGLLRARWGRGRGVRAVSSEDEPLRCLRSPRADPTLECTQLPSRELVGICILQLLEQILRGAIRLLVQPCADARPNVLERIRSRAPRPCRLRLHLVRWPNLAPLPRTREASQEAIQIDLSPWKGARDRPRREVCQVLLDRADLVEKSQGVHRDCYAAQPLLHGVLDVVRFQKARGGRLSAYFGHREHQDRGS